MNTTNGASTTPFVFYFFSKEDAAKRCHTFTPDVPCNSFINFVD
jgi:hypothetical protein